MNRFFPGVSFMPLSPSSRRDFAVESAENGEKQEEQAFVHLFLSVILSHVGKSPLK